MSERNVPSSLDEYRDWLEANAQIGQHRFLFAVRPHMVLLKPKGRILEFGGYVGATARQFAKKGHEVTSIECSDTYCDEFEKNTAGLGIKLIRGLIEHFSEPGSYDTVTCTEILNHVCDPCRVIEVGYESLREGGQMFVTVPYEKMRVERKHITLDELADLMEQGGFTIKDKMIWDDGQNTAQSVVRGVK